jgi:hypothetical protein
MRFAVPWYESRMEGRMMIKDRNFPHRKNKLSSFDSICPRCFRTISTRRTEEELKQDETNHMCDGDSLARRGRVELARDEVLR